MLFSLNKNPSAPRLPAPTYLLCLVPLPTVFPTLTPNPLLSRTLKLEESIPVNHHRLLSWRLLKTFFSLRILYMTG
ncbi:hypothetical protein I315_02261 [Cryptococcus gattii Ru294]|nr:hypothetical protein I315_02261 [Cryptococcus gattii Ru294]